MKITFIGGGNMATALIGGIKSRVSPPLACKSSNPSMLRGRN